ncbi:hypothetical protein AB1L30_01275 [Bremerella sp. JC817]|uniref:hypothetical protein n=1 Tax=Bremerella sp. JC817 TaxID=3231756 RepID=UPI00345745E6
MNDSEKKTLATISKAVEGLKPDQYVTLRAGDVATICRLAGQPAASTTPVKVDAK